MTRLSNLSNPDRKVRPIRIMQFGAGNFIRAFVNWMVEELNTKTHFNGDIAVVKPTKDGDYRLLKEQNGLFHVVLKGIRNNQFTTERTLINCIQTIIHPYQDWTTYLRLAENPDLRYIVSNTTESGIRFNRSDGLTDAPPDEFPAKLTIWLLRRFQHFKGRLDKTCIILPLELVPQNGELLKDCILEYASLWKLDRKFTDWIHAQTFCNTLVDRIVSGYSAEAAAELKYEKGIIDDLIVMGESYHSWVIQGPDWVKDELPFEETSLNVRFTHDLDIYRKIKVRLLNGAHTSLVPIGYLKGYRTVYEAISDRNIRSFIKEELFTEIIPTINFPPDELKVFAEDVINRFSNPTLHHKLLDIALNSTSKFVTRLLPTILDYHEKYNHLPPRLLFALAGLIKFYSGNWKNNSIPLKDEPERIEFFDKVWSKHSHSLDLLVAAVLGNEDIK